MNGISTAPAGSSDAVLYAAQSLTSPQKAQAATNIGLGTTDTPTFPGIRSGFLGFSIPTTRYICPFVAYGNPVSSSSHDTSILLFAPFYISAERTISELVFEVTQATGVVGAVVSVAAYAPKSATDPGPGLRIANSAASVSSETTGVKTVSYSPTWTAPAGMIWLGYKVAAASYTAATQLKCFDGGGRESMFAGALFRGMGANPTADYNTPGVPYVTLSDAAYVGADYTNITLAFSNRPNLAIFIR